jgi:hypothetical protein
MHGLSIRQGFFPDDATSSTFGPKVAGSISTAVKWFFSLPGVERSWIEP